MSMATAVENLRTLYAHFERRPDFVLSFPLEPVI